MAHDLTHPFRWEMVPYTGGDGIQVNVRDEKYFPHFLGVGASRLKVFGGAVFDFAVADDLSETTVDNVWRVVKQGGHLVLIVDTKTPTPLPKGGWDWKLRLTHEEKVMLVYQKLNRKDHIESYMDYSPEGKTACVVRYGAVGDMIQTSSVLARLREAGYHNTLMCHAGNSFDVTQHDPNVDRFIIQEKDQVPQEWLGPFWTHWMGKFDKFVNLSGSVESTWLAIEHRYPFYWPQHVRHHYMDENYLEFMHRLAEVPLQYSPTFYPSKKEKEWAAKQKKKFGKTILWALSGSSCHKWWPHMDAIIAKVMLEYPDWRVVLVGDEASQILETGWENEPRVVKKCNRWKYRQSLTFATQAADVVIGPETGILNAVSHMSVPKMVFLSHSSVNNLTRDWVNARSLTPEGCDCFPCHVLHTNGFTWCHQDEQSGAADCQVKISPAQAWAALNEIMREM